ncbi:hypothetical protein BELL_0162g00030 [Botrytis elliptica]|uniref:Uncharacterized protein n=1 Tax=Botrytis elliptica TaxID=278938 RepID=A0A4Z1JYG5_9HELO|nr:hypothetical protein BELL_0162g00030 [Botrytis elliptica]
MTVQTKEQLTCWISVLYFAVLSVILATVHYYPNAIPLFLTPLFTQREFTKYPMIVNDERLKSARDWNVGVTDHD